tara:strand:+ start:832 stop:1935 length:1104 start_codon:yes stop_codon:yes gene_type:complete
MKIGIDARSAMLHKKGGFGVYTRNLIKSMALLYPEHIFELKHQKEIEHGFNNLNNVKNYKLSFPLNMLWTQIRLPMHFLLNKPDIFLFPSQTISKFSSIKKVVTIHDLRFKAIENHDKSEYFRLNIQIKDCIEYSDRIICVSNQTKSDLIKYYSVDEKKIKVIYHGANHIKEINESTITYRKNDLMKKFKIRRDFLLTVGYTHKHKNIVRVVSCLGDLIKDGYDLDLVIVGPQGNDEKNIQEKISNLGLNDRVIRIPYAESKLLGYLYHFSNLFIYPSTYEGFGFPVLESMRSGGAVLGSNAGSIPEIGGNAMEYFNLDEPEELTAKVKSIISDVEKREILKLRGYKHARNFLWENTAKMMMESLQI